MKKSLCVLLFCIMVLQLSGCSSTPNSLQMDLSRGYGEHLKLLHLNASTSEKRERIQAFSALFWKLNLWINRFPCSLTIRTIFWKLPLGRAASSPL